jgi:hypothetical protein
MRRGGAGAARSVVGCCNGDAASGGGWKNNEAGCPSPPCGDHVGD